MYFVLIVMIDWSATLFVYHSFSVAHSGCYFHQYQPAINTVKVPTLSVPWVLQEHSTKHMSREYTFQEQIWTIFENVQDLELDHDVFPMCSK